jgi:hypothetical protein
MKKILTIMGLVAATTLVNAQGFIQFVGSVAGIQTNTGTFLAAGGEVSGSTFGKISASSIAPGAYDFALLWASSALTGGAGNPSWNLMTTNGGAAGSLLGNNGSAPGSLLGNGNTSGVAVDLASGTPVSIMVVGWSVSLGSSWSTVLAELNSGIWQAPGYFGETGVGTITPFATSGAGDPSIFPTTFANNTMNLYAVPTPEPATIALAGLGGLSMLIFRRRKS